MRETINNFLEFLKKTEKKGSSDNTIASYRRDVDNLINYFDSSAVTLNKITNTNLNSYLIHLEKK